MRTIGLVRGGAETVPHSAQPARVSVADLPETLARIAEDRDWTALEALCDQHILAVEGELAARLFFVLGLVPDAELRARPRLMISWIGAYYAVNQPEVSELRLFLRHYMELGTQPSSARCPASTPYRALAGFLCNEV